MIKKEKKKEKKPGKLKPVEGYHEPVYPVKEAFSRNRGLLLDYVPSSWLKTGLSAAALLALTLNVNPVSAIESTGNENRIVCNENEKQDRETIREEKVEIAPLFIHGDGLGAIGCVVISPPVFLSEADALEVITAVLEKEGITFDKQIYVLDNIYSVDEISQQYYITKDVEDARNAKKFPFYFDLYNTEYNIGVKYISMKNCDDFAELRSFAQDERELRKIEKDPHVVTGIAIKHYGSSVRSYDMIGVSQRIREYSRQNGNVNVVLFYDPLVSGGSNVVSRKSESKGTNMSSNARQLLAQQVEDFGRWFGNTFKKSIETNKNEIR
jgi:hypothetical protein